MTPPRPGPPSVDAFCALAPGKPLDIDMVRRTVASAQWAASSVQGRPWPSLAAGGWSIKPVRIAVVVSGGEEGVAEPARVLAKVGTKVGADPAVPRVRLQLDTDGGRMRLLRLGGA